MSVFACHFCRPFDLQYCGPARLRFLGQPHHFPSPVYASGADIFSLQSEVITLTGFCSHRLVSESKKCDIETVISNWSAEVFSASLGDVQTDSEGLRQKLYKHRNIMPFY
jgi:hypothetical protein